MAQHEVTAPVELLDRGGHLIEEGWAKRPYWNYNRTAIKAPWYRIKEWDYYYILSQERGYGITFTMSDLGYAGLFSMTWLDFDARSFIQADSMSILPAGRTGFPPSSESGDVAYEDKKLSVAFRLKKGERHITASCPGFSDGKGLSCDITLNQDPAADSMVIATSWKENRRAFYYNRKVNCMPASGTVTIGGTRHDFSPTDSFGGLDWGRGYWTYKNRWYWGSASGLLDGIPFGWNIGYGFSDRTPASENMVFYDGRAHKLDEVTFHIDPGSYLVPWRFTSNDGRFEMDFEPAIDRHSETNMAVIKSIQHQVFGYFTGRVVLDDGRKLAVNRFLGFAENVLNQW